MSQVEKYGRAGQTTDDSMAHSHCVLGTYGYKHTINTFPLQKLRNERPSMSRHTCIA
jgi:hypothetical protein